MIYKSNTNFYLITKIYAFLDVWLDFLRYLGSFRRKNGPFFIDIFSISFKKG